MNYTKGEWTLFEHGITSQIMCGKYKVAEGIYNKANAHLIVASPDLFSALETLIKGLAYSLSSTAPEWDRAKQALAKAEGKSHNSHLSTPCRLTGQVCPFCGMNLVAERDAFGEDKLFTEHSCYGSELAKQELIEQKEIIGGG